MKKTTVYTLTLLFLCLNLLQGQSTFSNNQMLINFNASASSYQINSLKSQLGASETSLLPATNVRSWDVGSFPITFTDNNGTFQTLNNILEVVNYSAGQASVDNAGLNYNLDSPSGSGQFHSAPDPNNYDPIPDCPNYPSELYCNGENSSVKIGIIDTGLDAIHGFITDNVTNQFNFINYTTNVQDNNGHGTQTSGIITAELLTANVKNFELSILKAFDNSGQGTLLNAINAIDHAINTGVNILNLSWGYTPTAGDNINPILKNVLQKASDSGLLIIASAGNNGENLDDKAYYPAGFSDIPSLISIAGTDCSGNISSFSNYGGGTVHIAAPGDDVLSPTLDGLWKLDSGTSFSAAIVTGIAGQLASKLTNGFDAMTIKCLILTKSMPLNGLNNQVMTNALVDAGKACNMGCTEEVDYRSEEVEPFDFHEKIAMKIYPNPFSQELNFQFHANQDGQGSLQLFNAFGQRVLIHQFGFQEGNNQLGLETFSGQLENGIYFMELHVDGQKYTQKVIKKS